MVAPTMTNGEALCGAPGWPASAQAAWPTGGSIETQAAGLGHDLGTVATVAASKHP
jgi:hypothetical protein